MKPPTEKQYRALLIVGPGRVLLTAREREHGSLLRRGWLEPAWPDPEFTDKYLPPLRITSAGMRALADGMDLYGQEEVKLVESHLAVRQCSCERGERPSEGCRVHGVEESARQRDERAVRRECMRLAGRLERIAELAKGESA